MLALLFLTVLLIGSPGHTAESDTTLEGLESRLQNVLKAAEQSGLSTKEVVARLKQGRDKLYRELQAKTRVELEILLSYDALDIGPLIILNLDAPPSDRSASQLRSPEQLQSYAQDFARQLTTALHQQQAHIRKLVKQLGGGYKTCQAADDATTEIPLIELTTWANSYDFRVNKMRGVRRFNEMFQRLKAEIKQQHQIRAFDCMIASFIHRTTNKDNTTAQELSGRPTVVDADTLILSDTRIRLHGIDAPEKEQRCSYTNGVDYLCGVAATEELRAKIGKASIKCLITGRGKYKRLLGQCHLGDVDLSQWLVVNGYALAYRPSSTQYVLEEETAKSAKRGIWSGSFEKPWEWRRRH